MPRTPLTSDFATYAYDQGAPGASAEAAIAAAARQSLLALMPSRSVQIEAAYQQAFWTSDGGPH